MLGKEIGREGGDIWQRPRDVLWFGVSCRRNLGASFGRD